jgi:hypothetical protein
VPVRTKWRDMRNRRWEAGTKALKRHKLISNALAGAGSNPVSVTIQLESKTPKIRPAQPPNPLDG